MRTSVDVLVIGGGVLGAATLHELAERGLRVALVERGMPNRQGSGTTAGNLHIQAIHTKRPGQLVPVESSRLVPAQRAASDLWADLEERLDARLEVTRSGGFTVAETAEEVDELTTKSAWEAAAGIPTEVVSGDEARRAMPLLGDSVAAATWCPWDGYANPLLATPAYLALAARRGAIIRTHARVSAITKVTDGWNVDTSGGDFAAGIVINAAGPWIREISALAGFDVAMSPVAIQMHETVRAPRMMNSLVQHIGRGLSVKQVATGNIVIGGGWPAGRLELEGTSSISDASVEGNLSEAYRILPGVRDVRVSRVWAGPLAATPDEMPVIGEIENSGGFFIEGGTYSFTFSPLWARVSADLITGQQTPVDVTEFTPNRLLNTNPRSGLLLDSEVVL